MKNLLSVLILINIMFTLEIKAQTGVQDYCDFEGNKTIYFGYSCGRMDSIYTNPSLSAVNSSVHCARYISDTILYDNFQLHTINKLMDIAAFENAGTSAPKIEMKIFSTAPVGTMIQLQLGSSSITGYPAGLRSEYAAYTTVKNAWQNLKFNFTQLTPGGTVSTLNIDKLVFLVHPGIINIDTTYFDDLKGPTISTVGVALAEGLPAFKLFQNSPNPAKENTNINFQINGSGEVSLKLFDMLGNPVFSLIDQKLKSGNYSIPVETEAIPNGIYFYVLKKDGLSRSMKMIVSK